jgi:hypothetical protein
MEKEPIPSGKADPASGENQNQSSNDVVKYESYKKVLSEKKELQDRFRQLQSELDAIKEQKLLESGKEREALEQTKLKLKEFEQKFSEQSRKFKERLVTEQIKRKANEHGCVDPDALIKLADFSTIEVDEDFNIKSGLDDAIAKLKQEKTYLFKSNVSGVKDLPPVNNMEGFKQKTAFEMSKEDILKALKS